MAEARLAEKLFAEFERQLERHGLLLKRGTMIDATLVETPFRPGREDEADKGATPPVDADAALTARQGRRGTHYGYKAHAGVEVETRLIRRLVLTPANINETTIADALVCGDERAVYADKAYAKRARRAWLRSLRIKDRIMHKSWGGGPSLRASQKRHNALIAPIRAQVEGVFATLKRWMGFDRVRYVGLAKNTAHLHLVGLAYNMKRGLKLAG